MDFFEFDNFDEETSNENDSNDNDSSNNENDENEAEEDESADNNNDSEKEKIAKLNAEKAKTRKLFMLNNKVASVMIPCPICNESLLRKPFYFTYIEGKKNPVMKKYKSFVCDRCKAQFRNKIPLPKKKKPAEDT